MIGKLMRYLQLFLGGGGTKTEIELLKEKGLIIGDNTIIHSPYCFDQLYPWLIEVGSNCLFSTDVRILAHDSSMNRVQGITKVGRVIIGNNVYLGFRTTVLCDVRIGDNVVIGAGSVVTRDLPPNGVYAGSPARFVCSIGEFDERHRSNLIDHPQFIQPWRYWRDSATAEERQDMKERLKNGFGYIR